jgi:uncharacterized protein (UPF0332 family)
MPIGLDDLAPHLSTAEEAFQYGGQSHEEGLNVSNAKLVHLRKACRLLSGATELIADGYYTLTIEAAFTSIERSLLFWLITEGNHDPSQPPGSHTTAIKRSAEVGYITEAVATKLTELWRNNRAQTYYQDGIATAERAEAMLSLATEIHSQALSLAGFRHECLCEQSG